MAAPLDDDWLDTPWLPWRTLDPSAGELDALPTEPGVYRVWHPDYDELVYIGETGRSLRGRVRALARGVYADRMPYRDPHTAAPCLWAIRAEHGPELAVSVATPGAADTKRARKGFEAALIAVHRRDVGTSPTANFARMIPGYTQSSYRKDGERGGPRTDGEADPHTAAGVDPLPWTDWASPTAGSWMGLEWTSPLPLADIDTAVPTTNGVYRLWDTSAPPLEYIGQSANLKSRLYRHRRQRDGSLRVSYATLPACDTRHTHEEIETDLIGAHWLATTASPADQF